MTSRERVFAALRHEQPDRCPVDYWATPEVNEKLMAHLGVRDTDALLDALQVDMQIVRPDLLAPPEKLPDGSFYDERGVRVRMVKNEYNAYPEFVGASLGDAETVRDLEAFTRWQNVDLYDWDGFAEKCRAAAEKRVLRLGTGGIFETAIALRGYEQFLMDLIIDPDIPRYMMTRMTDFWCAFVQRTMDCGAGKYIDIVYTYDDIASQRSLLISHEMLEAFVYPQHRRLDALVHAHGKRVMYHSCGAVAPEIPSLAALPVDILNPLQPLAAGIDNREIKKTYGDTLCFHGAICIQQLLPKGTPQEVREKVRETIGVLGENGGYIMASAHYIQNDAPVENILAMYDPALR